MTYDDPKGTGWLPTQGRPQRDDRESVSITVPVAIVTALALVAAAALLLLPDDPGSNDGAAGMLAVLVVPALAVAAIVQVYAHHAGPDRRIQPGFLIWALGVLPGGILLLHIWPMAQHPRYYASATVGEYLGSLAGMLLMIALGMLLGLLVWAIVVIPIMLVVRALTEWVRNLSGPPR